MKNKLEKPHDIVLHSATGLKSWWYDPQTDTHWNPSYIEEHGWGVVEDYRNKRAKHEE